MMQLYLDMHHTLVLQPSRKGLAVEDLMAEKIMQQR